MYSKNTELTAIKIPNNYDEFSKSISKICGDLNRELNKFSPFGTSDTEIYIKNIYKTPHNFVYKFTIQQWSYSMDGYQIFTIIWDFDSCQWYYQCK